MTNAKSTKRALLTSVMALILCFTMLLGTTFAWFTDTVTSSGNIIKSGTLEVGMYWAPGQDDVPNAGDAAWHNADTSVNPEDGKIFTHQNWEPGYIDAKHILIQNEGSLALNYELRITAASTVSKLAEVIDVYLFETATKLDRQTVESISYSTKDTTASARYLGTLDDLLTNGLVGKNIYGTLEKDESRTLSLALMMQVTAGNEYQDLTFGDFSVQLIATQLASESDSFDEKYDEDSLYDNIPAATVKSYGSKIVTATAGIGGEVINGLELDESFSFEPNESLDDAQQSVFKYWHADYVVIPDKDVAADSVALAGYYQAWCGVEGDPSNTGFMDQQGKWVTIMGNPGDTIQAGDEIRLVSLLGDGNITVNYEAICQYGNDDIGFLCGIANLDGANAGTKVTVELRIYRTTGDPNTTTGPKNEETFSGPGGEQVEGIDYIVIGSYTHVLGEKPLLVKDDASLNAAINAGVTSIRLAAGEYRMPSSSSVTELNIVGPKDAVVDMTWGAYMDNANVTFEGVTIETSTGYVTTDGVNHGSDYAAFYSPNVTYTNCTFSGPMRVGRDGAKFINCTFNNLGNDYVWTYGNDVTFDGCTFNSEGKALLIYSDGGNEISQVVVKNCTFNATQGAKAGAIANQNCAAIEIHNHGNGVNLVTSGNTINSNFSGEWRIKTYESGRPGITVNGVEYTQIALDGKLMTIDGSNNVTVQ